MEKGIPLDLQSHPFQCPAAREVAVNILKLRKTK